MNKITLCTDPVLQKYLKKKGVEAGGFDSILTQEEKIEMLEGLDRFNCSWFLTQEGDDYTVYRGVSIGAGVHDEIMNFFQLLLHFVFLLDKIIKPNTKLMLYQSISCQMPKIIEELIKICGGSVKTLNSRKRRAFPDMNFNYLETVWIPWEKDRERVEREYGVSLNTRKRCITVPFEGRHPKVIEEKIAKTKFF